MLLVRVHLRVMSFLFVQRGVESIFQFFFFLKFPNLSKILNAFQFLVGVCIFCIVDLIKCLLTVLVLHKLKPE